MHSKGFFRVAACSPKVEVGDCMANVGHIISIAGDLDRQYVDLAVFPELCVTGYTCADLFHNKGLLDACGRAIARIVAASRSDLHMPIVIGAPVAIDNAMYNCALVIYRGKIVAAVPKTFIPNYNEFYERRWFAPAPEWQTEVCVYGDNVVFGANQIIDVGGVKMAVDICEDLWTPIPPSCHAALAGADVIVNLSASDDLIGKYSYLRSLIAQQSARCICGYVYASAGYGESSTDLVFDGKTIIAENGRILAANKRWVSGDQYVIADLDIEALRHDRIHTGSYNDCAARNETPYKVCTLPYDLSRNDGNIHSLFRTIDPLPFVPPTDDAINAHCDEITNIQVAGLAKRLDFIRCKSLVVGVSGGLDSTLALLVAVKAFDRLGLDRKGIIGVTMPGFGTTGRTHDNAVKLMRQLGITTREISIVPAVEQHFRDIGHDAQVHDVTYENAQARQRTYLLMDIANQTGGIVLGTGDLSELALGWATYNGDQMSMYGVNAGVPKTLVRYLVRHFANTAVDAEARATLDDIIDTPISPELIPADKDGNITQKTEDLVGPYELHDFFLYYTLRYGFSTDKILMMACLAFVDRYHEATISKWLDTFMRRFFQQQFKRSCMPDGPKVGSVCLSPRGDWRMPSDASSNAWRISTKNC